MNMSACLRTRLGGCLRAALVKSQMPRMYEDLDAEQVRNILELDYLFPAVNTNVSSMWWTFCQTGSFKSDDIVSLDVNAALLLLLFVLDGFTHCEENQSKECRQSFLISGIPNSVATWQNGHDVSAALGRIRRGEYTDEDRSDEDAVREFLPQFTQNFRKFRELIDGEKGWSPLEHIENESVKLKVIEALSSNSPRSEDERNDIFRFLRVLAWGCDVLLPHKVVELFASSLYSTET